MQREMGPRQREFEKDALANALAQEHEDGGHDEYAQRDCPECEYDGHYPEKRRGA